MQIPPTLDTILFDLDGTLIPMDQDVFLQAYFSRIRQRAVQLGLDPAAFMQALFKGTQAMLQGDRARTNYQRFWEAFTQDMGAEYRALEDPLTDFYATDFNQIQSLMDPPPDAPGLMGCLRAKGYTLILATNPLFPLVAIDSRLGWVGLSAQDFCLVTTYENSHFCKPNLAYYQDILRQAGKTPQQCMMVGNNPLEDMAAGQLGLSLFLVTGHLENPQNLDTSAYPQGDFSALLRLAQSLPALG
mgnify:FL=1